jgi:hypothetical protein
VWIPPTFTPKEGCFSSLFHCYQFALKSLFDVLSYPPFCSFGCFLILFKHLFFACLTQRACNAMSSVNPAIYDDHQRFEGRAFDPVLWGAWFGQKNFYSPTYGLLRQGLLKTFPTNTEGLGNCAFINPCVMSAFDCSAAFKKRFMFRSIMESLVLVRGYQYMWRPLQCADDIGESLHSERTYMACLYPRMAVQIQMRHT